MSIVLTGLTRRFGTLVVVDRVSLEVADGELFVLLGPSGCGKSTILRLVAGLLEPDAGTIVLHGRDVTHLPPQARNTGFVFQNYSIFHHMTVAQNVEFGLLIRGVGPAERRARAEALLDLVGLAGLGGRFASQISGGQQQRVALARALAYEPAVLLLDEPFGALDTQIRAQLRDSLREVQQKLHLTTILVTHDQEEAFQLGDRIGVVDGGHLLEVGTPEDLYHRPHSEFAATFIGNGNVLVGRMSETCVRLGSACLALPSEAPSHDTGARVRVLFRPEAVELRADPFGPEEDVRILGQGTVVERVFAGASERVMLTVEGLQGARPIRPPREFGQRLTRIEALRSNGVPTASSFQPGQRVWIGLRHYHILEPVGPKILVYADGGPDEAMVVGQACRLALAVRGSVSVLAVASRSDEAAARQHVEELLSPWREALPRVEARVRGGRVTDEVVLEAQEGSYEIVVLGRGGPGIVGPGVGLGDLPRNLLHDAEVPVMVVPDTRPALRRLLICVGVGEPTKVHTGSRMAWRAGATTTVLHVTGPENSGEERLRGQRHLELAARSVEALGVPCVMRHLEGPVVECVRTEAMAVDPDMLVIGAPVPASRRAPDVASRIVEAVACPILIVPRAT